MDAEKFFKDMYYNIWQSNDLSRFDDFYAKDFIETISVSDKDNQPLEIKLNYEELLKEAKKQKKNIEILQ